MPLRLRSHIPPIIPFLPIVAASGPVGLAPLDPAPLLLVVRRVHIVGRDAGRFVFDLFG